MRVFQALARLFPPPRYLTLPAAGIDISDSSVKYVRFDPSPKGLTLAAWGDIPLEDGILNAGVISNPQGLAAVLRKAQAASGAEFARISLPEERAYLFETAVEKNLGDREIRAALEFRLEENVPLSPRDALFDYDLVKNTSGSDQQLSVTVYGKDVIASYFDACRSANVIPLSFEVEAQAIARAVIREGDEAAHFIVDFGKRRTGIGIVQHGVLLFTTTIDVGGEELDAAIARVRPDVVPEELMRLKNECGVLHIPGEEAVTEAILGPVATFKNELQTRVAYWNSRHEGETGFAIESIILCGGIANLAGLPDYLSEELGIKAVQANVWQNALDKDVVPPITKRHSYGYATAIGLALGHQHY